MQIYRFCKHIVSFPLEASVLECFLPRKYRAIQSCDTLYSSLPSHRCTKRVSPQFTCVHIRHHFSFPQIRPLLRQTLEQAIAATFDTDAQWYIAVARSPNVLGNLPSHVPGIAHCRVETPNKRVFNTLPVTLTQREVTVCHEISTRCRCRRVFSTRYNNGNPPCLLFDSLLSSPFSRLNVCVFQMHICDA